MPRRTRNVEQDVLPCRRPAALEQLHAQLPAGSLQTQAQRRRGRLRREGRGTQAESRAAALARRQLQAAQAVGRQAGAKPIVQPEQRRRHAAAAQGLDPGPQRVARTARKNQAQAGEVKAGGGPGRRMGSMRRRQQQNAAAGGGQRGQRRPQQAELADTFVLDQKLGQRATRPAAAGQLGIKNGETAGKSRRWRHGEGVAATDLAALQRPAKGGMHGKRGYKA